MARIAVLNPNRSQWMTQRVCAALGEALGEGLGATSSAGAELDGVTASDGPEVIDSAPSFELAGQRIHHEARGFVERHGRPAAMVLACFGDPGLEALQTDPALPPVVGLAHAAMRCAAEGGERFAVLTCGADWEALLSQRADAFGLATQLAGVWSLPVNGSAFASDPAAWWPALMRHADAAAEAGARRLILGGAVFAGLKPPPLRAGLEWVDAIEATAQTLREALGGVLGDSAP
jgi:allantoin racemase